MADTELTPDQNALLDTLIAETEQRIKDIEKSYEETNRWLVVAEGAHEEAKRLLETLKRKRGTNDVLTLSQLKTMLGADSVEIVENKPQEE